MQNYNFPAGEYLGTIIYDKYTRIPRQQHGAPMRYDHVTRSHIQDFLIQSILEVEGYGQYIVNYIYHHDTRANQLIYTFLRVKILKHGQLHCKTNLDN